MTPESPSKPAKDPSVARGRDEDAAEKTTDTMTSSTDDTNSTPQSSAEQKTDPTSEVMSSQHAEQPAEELAATNVEPIEFKKIEEIMTKSKELEERIASYNGIPGSKDYIYIEESLVAILLQLDKVEINGNMEIRRRRKSAVCSIQQMLTDLETKAKNNMATTETDSDTTEAMATGEVTDLSTAEQPSTTASGEDSILNVDPSNTTDSDTTEAMATDEVTDLSTAEQPSTTVSGEDSILNVDPSNTTDSDTTEAMATDEVTDVSTAEQPSTATSGEDSLSNDDPSNTTDTDTTEAMATDEAADLSTAEQPSTATSGEDSILNVDPSNTTDEEAAAVSDEEITGDVCVEELSSEHSTVQSDGSPDSTLYDNNSR